MPEICPVCGLPKQVCMCGEIAKEEQVINIKVEKRRFGKEVTVIDGLDRKDINLNELAAKLKSICACGGTAKKGKILLQGNHKQKAYDALVSLGFPSNKIEVE